MENTITEMQRVLESQKNHFIKEGSPSIELRVDRLNRLKSLIMDNRYDLVDALNEDYGNRSKNTSIMTDAYSIIPDINNAIKNIKQWTRPKKRSSNFPFGLFGAKSYVRHEPLGTVGMISPWNFPVNLTFKPLAAIFAAGNQVMHKPSELTPLTASLIKELCDKSYDENEFATF
jgi:coniferyl-aldehyde dehydrogenase